MRVGTRKHEDHDYFFNKLFADTKKRIDDKFRQRIKGMARLAATARYEGREEDEKQACLEIEEVQAEWMTLGRLRPYSTKFSINLYTPGMSSIIVCENNVKNP